MHTDEFTGGQTELPAAPPLTVLNVTAPAPPPSLTQRGRDLLAALRGEAADRRPEQEDPPAAEPIPLAFIAPADETIDAELAALALLRQLTGPPAGVALLMLDPLGATLRLSKPAGKAQPPQRTAPRPQYRVGNRGDWPDLLGRLPRDTRMLLVLDTTGEQHRLLADPAPTVIVLATTGAEGRVAGYRRLKELDQDGAGQIGVFFTPETPLNLGPGLADDADDDTGPASDVTHQTPGHTAESSQSDASGQTPDPASSGETFAESALATFARLAATARQFLGRRLEYFGAADAGNAPPTDATRIELLGQRPSLEGQENRSELTRWLAEHGTPLKCATEETAEPAALAEPVEPAKADEPPVATEQSETQAAPLWSAPANGGAMAGAEPSQSGVAAAALHNECPGSDALANPKASRSPTNALPVVPVESLPADEREWSEFVARNAHLISPGLAVLDFRPPPDPTTVLAVSAGPGDRTLLLIRHAGPAEPLAAVAALLAVAQWAGQHWPLLRLAYPQTPLPVELKIEPVLLADPVTPALQQVATAALAPYQPVKMISLLPLDLSALGPDRPAFGLAMLPLVGTE